MTVVPLWKVPTFYRFVLIVRPTLLNSSYGVEGPDVLLFLDPSRARDTRPLLPDILALRDSPAPEFRCRARNVSIDSQAIGVAGVCMLPCGCVGLVWL